MPLVSVISVVKCDGHGLLETYKSLEAQSFQDWEFVIVVANSIDNTLEVALDLARANPKVKTYLEDDPGIYQSMNQGVKASKSDLVWFMNAGDAFFSETVLERAVNLMCRIKADVLVGGHSVRHLNFSENYIGKSGYFSLIEFAFNRKSGCHQSMLFNRLAVCDLGLFNLKYRLASDYDLVLRIIRQGNAFKDNAVYSVISPGGVADSNLTQVHLEKLAIRRSQLTFKGSFALSIMWFTAAIFKIRFKELIGAVRTNDINSLKN
jgi:glycosyltransferase involved in cell wall biosynthesis